MANTVLPATIAYTAAIPFNQPVTKIGDHTISGPITLTKVTTDAEVSFGAILRLTADGTNTPDFSAFKKIGTGSWVNTAGTVNQCWFIFDGNDYCVAFTQPVAITGGGGGGGGDTTPPTIIGAVATDLHTISITGSETLVGSSGFTFKKNGVAMTQTGVSSPTGTVRTYTFSDTMLSTDTITFDYAPGDVTDAATTPNALVAFTGHAVTNSIAGGGGGGLNIMSGWTAMDFTDNTNLSNPSEGVYKSTGAAGFTGFGLDPDRSPIFVSGSGQNCGVAFYFDGTLGAKLGFKTDGLKSDNFDYGIRTGATNLEIIDVPAAGGTVTGPALVAGTHYAILREAGVWVVRSTTDGGATWSAIIYTFTSNVSIINGLQVNAGCSVYGDAAYALTFPQKMGLS